MDRKMGLALHISMIEKACAEKWPINLLLTSVPDEEVNSTGMRVAVKELVRLREDHKLTYKLFLNGAHHFIRKPSDFLQFKQIIMQPLYIFEKCEPITIETFVITLLIEHYASRRTYTFLRIGVDK